MTGYLLEILLQRGSYRAIATSGRGLSNASILVRNPEPTDCAVFFSAQNVLISARLWTITP
jgi:hypothetical protein